MAIILSGCGSDGKKGVLEVKKAGGLVLVQSPKSCDHDGMPLAAISTGKVDYISVASEMPGIIRRHFEGLPQTSAPDERRNWRATY